MEPFDRLFGHGGAALRARPTLRGESERDAGMRRHRPMHSSDQALRAARSTGSPSGASASVHLNQTEETTTMKPRRISIVSLFLIFAIPLVQRDALAFSDTFCMYNGADPVCPSGPPTITNNGQNGHQMLVHPEIVPIFWGSYWVAHPDVRAQYLAAIQTIVNGPYLDQLKEYGSSYGSSTGFARARMSPIVAIKDTPVGSFSLSQTEGWINYLIGSGAVPPPSTGSDMLYSLFIDPNAVNVDDPGTYGHNQLGTCSSDCGAYNGRQYEQVQFYLPNVNPQSMTWTYTHELVEAITQNLTATCDGSTSVSQIADPCVCLMAGESYSPYWSAQKGGCVHPEGWQQVSVYQGSPMHWNALVPPVPILQVATGEYGSSCLEPTCTNLVVLGTDHHVYLYSGFYGFNFWEDISPPSPTQFSLLSVGEGWILGKNDGLNNNPNGVFKWTPQSNAWTALPSLPSSNNLTSIASGAFDLATDESGTPWLYTNGSWVLAGTPGDQFVVGHSWAAKLSPTHLSTRIWPGSGSWIDTHHSGSELFIGGSMSLAVRDLTSGWETISAMTTSFVGGNYVPNGWFVETNDACTDVALFGNGNEPLVRLTIPGGTQQDMDPIGSAFDWQLIGPGAKHLYGHNQNLVVAQGLNF
jgi:hypothetical protein